jgi:hypothetical protein
MLSFLKNLFGKKAETTVENAVEAVPYKVESTIKEAVIVSMAPEVAPALFIPVAGLMVKASDEAAVAPAVTAKAKTTGATKKPRAPKKKAV